MDGPDADRVGLVPAGGRHAGKRLRYYARQFPLVEVDATYYALPAEQTALAWAARTPNGFTFNVKAFSLFTHHPTPVAALPKDLRPAAEKTGKDRVYFNDVGPALADQVWERFLAALDPLRAERKLGAILLRFPPWFPISRARKDYIVACAARAAPERVCIEFRAGVAVSDVFAGGAPGARTQNPRIKSLSGAGSAGFMGVRAAGQAGCANPGEPGRTAANCNPNCNPAVLTSPLGPPQVSVGLDG
jgi:Protein of unknown function DUF72